VLYSISAQRRAIDGAAVRPGPVLAPGDRTG